MNASQVSFEEFWSLRMKNGQKRRQRDVKVTVIKAENVLNAGRLQQRECARESRCCAVLNITHSEARIRPPFGRVTEARQRFR